jgi:hypothetical protein
VQVFGRLSYVDGPQRFNASCRQGHDALPFAFRSLKKAATAAILTKGLSHQDAPISEVNAIPLKRSKLCTPILN